MTANGSPIPTVCRPRLAAAGVVPLPVASSRSVAPRADAVIRALQSSPMFGLAVQVYRSHLSASRAKTDSENSELVQTARSINTYQLSGLLYCRCGAAFCRSGWPDAKREYMTVCGCRLRPIDADIIERRVYADATMLDPAWTINGFTETAAQVLAGAYTRIEVGGTVDDVRFVPRT